jgi:hypothetical protein
MDAVVASAANPVVDLDVSGAQPTIFRPTLAEVMVTPLPVHVDMNRLIGVIFGRLSAIEGRLAALEQRLAAAPSAPSST